ncbi:MAG TPA: hypothetical protein VLE95_04580, partial [Chlamydiales bacterium]|nr:hypothetical protein [Chlamydiales bacterium]
MASPIPPGFDFSAVYVDDKKPKIKGIGGVVLYSKVCLPDGIYRIPITQIDPSDDKYEGSKDQKINNLANDTLKALDAYVRERQGDLSCPNARKLEVNWTSGIISYEDGFKLISLSFKEIQDTDLQRNAFIAGKQIASPMTTDPDIGSNRPLVQNKPLQISTQSWHQAHHISKEKYLEQHHASLDASLQAYAPGGLADSATQKIDAADAFIRKLREELETLRDAKRVELANIPIDHGAKKQKTLRELRQLEELIAQLAQSNLDTQAIFRSVPYANDELNGLTEVEQLTRAELSAEEMRGHLYKQHRYQSDRLNKWLGKPEPIFLDAYSQDKGDLLIHKQSDYEARV